MTKSVPQERPLHGPTSPPGPLEWEQAPARRGRLSVLQGKHWNLTREAGCSHQEQHRQEMDQWEPSTTQRGPVAGPLHYLNNRDLLLSTHSR